MHSWATWRKERSCTVKRGPQRPCFWGGRGPQFLEKSGDGSPSTLTWASLFLGTPEPGPAELPWSPSRGGCFSKAGGPAPGSAAVSEALICLQQLLTISGMMQREGRGPVGGGSKLPLCNHSVICEHVLLSFSLVPLSNNVG